jgi:hypothetical protein
MSTKTSIKRIAAVAAVALTLGGFSAVSAHATVYAESLSISASASTTTSDVLTSIVVTDSFLSTNTDSTTAAAFLVSAPAGNTALPNITVSSAQILANAVTNSTAVATTLQSVTVTAAAGAAISATASYTVALTASLPGTYVIKLVPGLTTTASATWTVTVSAKAAISPALSTFVTSVVNAGQGSDTLGVAAPMSATTLAVANIAATFLNGGIGGAALAPSDMPAITASTTGQCLVAWSTTPSAFGTSVSEAALLATTKTLHVRASGVAGICTITFSYLNAAGASVTIGTKAITFYGTAATVSLTVNNSVIGNTATLSNGTTTLDDPAVGAITAKVVDSLGNPVYGAQLYVVSDNTSAISDSYAMVPSTTAADGTVDITLHGVTAGTANIRVTNLSSAASTSTPIAGVATAVAIRVGTAVASSVAITFDKESYVPGELATVTITVKDVTGLAVPNGVYHVFTTAATSSLALPAGTLPGTAVTAVAASSVVSVPTILVGSVLVTDNAGGASFKINMPVVTGEVTFAATGASGLAVAQAGLAVTGKASVGVGAIGDAAQAAIDAAQEATDAANAAYDAANNAMDSADAATAAAQDASDNASAALAAVTSLSATVAKLVSSVAALASALTAIKKKLGVK